MKKVIVVCAVLLWISITAILANNLQRSLDNQSRLTRMAQDESRYHKARYDRLLKIRTLKKTIWIKKGAA